MLKLESGRVFQQGFVVEDFDSALQAFAQDLNIGGWLVIRKKEPWRVTYRGQKAGFHLSVALGYSGDMLYELIQQHDDAPSIYHEMPGAAGYGFHHWAMLVNSVDEARERYAAQGCETVMQLEGTTTVYVDTRPRLPGMVELIERTPTFESFANLVHDLRQPLGPDGPVIKVIG